MILKEVVLGWLLFHAPILPQPIHALEVHAIEANPEKKIVFKQAASEYDLSWKNGIGTGYYNGKDRMNGETGITASGWNLDAGIYFNGFRILAGDRSIPLGTLVDIKLADGEVIHGVVLDRGGAITSNRFDITFNSRSQCFQFGRQEIQWQEVGKIGTH